MKARKPKRVSPVAARRERGSLTTADAAELSRLSGTTIRRACNSGALSCFCIPGSTHRRIMPAALRAWLVASSVPTDLLDRAYPPAADRVPMQLAELDEST